MKNDRFVRLRIGTFRFSAWDIGAVVLIAAFAVYHFYLAHIGFHNPDETYFLATAQRILLGDSFIVDEWQVTQFTSVHQIIPLWIYRRITGGTDGIVLFFRCLYVVVHTLFGIWLYRVLRSDSWQAVFSLILYLSFIPWLTMAMEHYHMSIAFTIFLGIRLFWKPAAGRFRKAFCGVIFAFLVLVEPLMVALYPVYTGVVIVHARQKAEHEEADYRSKSFWIWSSVGVAITAAAFFLFLFSRATVHELFEAIPKLFQDSEYPMDRSVWFVLTRFTQKGMPVFASENKNLAIGLLLLFPVAAAIMARMHKFQYRNIVVFASALFLAYMLIASLGRWTVDQYLLIPFVWFGLVCGLLTEKKNKKVSAFFWYGLFFAFLLNVSSECERGVGTIIPALICPQICQLYANEMHAASVLRQHVGNLRTLQIRKRAVGFFETCLNRGAKPLIAACLCAVLLTQGVFLIRESRGDCFLDATTRENQTERKPGVVYDTELRRGPYRGITTTAERAEIYEDVLRDLDKIRAEMNAGDTFYIANVLPWGYLYMDVSVYTPYSAYCVVVDIETRQIQYWEMHPEKIPDYIYLPNIRDPWYEKDESVDQILQTIQEHFDCQVTQGNRGFIVHANGMRQRV